MTSHFFNNYIFFLTIIYLSILIWNLPLNSYFFQVIEVFIVYNYFLELVLKTWALGLSTITKFSMLDEIITFFIIGGVLGDFYYGWKSDIFRTFLVLKLFQIHSFKLILQRLYYTMKKLNTFMFFIALAFTTCSLIGIYLFSGFLKRRCVTFETGIVDDINFICGNAKCPEKSICTLQFDNPDYGLTSYENFFTASLQVKIKKNIMNNFIFLTIFLLYNQPAIHQ